MKLLIVLVQQELLKIRYRWTDTDGGNDNQLDIDEFLAFRHPEMASRTYRFIVDDIITQLGLSFSPSQRKIPIISL